MLNLPQPRLPTPVFDGTSPTFPEWARELRAYLNSSQFEYINLFDFAYDAEEPLTTDIMVLQTAAGARQNTEIVRHRARIQALRAERELPQEELSRTCSHRRGHPECQQRPQCTTSTSGCCNYSSTSSRRTLRLPHHARYKAG